MSRIVQTQMTSYRNQSEGGVVNTCLIAGPYTNMGASKILNTLSRVLEIVVRSLSKPFFSGKKSIDYKGIWVEFYS